MKQKSIQFMFVLLVGPSILLQLACSGYSTHAEVGPPSAVSVQVIKVKLAPFPDFYEAAGTVKAQERAEIASKLTGTVLEVSVKPGDLVRKGQVLVRIESDELSAGVAQAEAGVAAADKGIVEAEKGLDAANAEARLASVTYTRYKQLLDKRSVTQAEFDQAEARRQSAQAAVEMASARVQQARAQRDQASAMLNIGQLRKGYAQISAPFDGIVTEKQADPGTLAAAGMKLLSIERAGVYRLEAALPETEMPQVRMGDSVKISISAIGLDTTGRVVEIEPSADVATRTSLIKISLPASNRLRSGMFGRALFSRAETNAIAVPTCSITRHGQLVSVFALSDGVARQRLVTLGRTAGDSVEVLSGISEDDQVVISSSVALVDGQRVEIGK